MNSHPSLRLTPSTSNNNNNSSPFFRNNTAPRSPAKPSKSEEPGLHLRKVIGTTTASLNAFDCLPATRQFAYTAGAAAVVATLEPDLKVTQQFFRARPTLPTTARDGTAQWPTSPAANEARLRGIGALRDQSSAGSPLQSGRDWLDSPTGKTLTAKDRIKAATSVALSPNGKWLAIGETGYRPRILIFRIGDDVSEMPAASVAEHSFGVHALAFSLDSRCLASLGTVNDGFLHIWNVDDRTGATTLYASNKCTSTINCMEWLGRSIVTVGLRFIKIWRPDEDNMAAEVRNSEPNGGVVTPRLKADPRPSEFTNSILTPRHKVLAGKNSLLGDMLENFVCLLPIDDSKAVICAESGEVCLLDDSERTQTLTCSHTTDFRISAARLDNRGQLHIAGTLGEAKIMSLDDLYRSQSPNKTGRSKTRRAVQPRSTIITAMATIGDIIVELDSQRGIRLTESADSDEEAIEAFSHQLPAHEDAVLGVHCIESAELPNAAFLTFSGTGTIQLWDGQGVLAGRLIVPIDTSPDMYGLCNELKAVTDLVNGSLIAAGDKYGTLSLIDIKSNEIVTQVRAHSSEITDIASFERTGATFVVTASRDRTVQLFAWHSRTLGLLQTMDEHAAAVTGLLVTTDGERLLSCSTDRSVAVREAMVRDERDAHSMAFMFVRAVTLKSSPTSMCFAPQTDVVLIAAMDRTIGSFNIRTGQSGFSFKCSDADGGEAAVVSRVIYAPSLNGSPTIIGASSSDKSVRLYSEFGTLIARDWGHTEGITDIALLPVGESDRKSLTLVSVAADSTIFMWDTTPAPPPLVRHQTEPTEVAETPAKPALSGPPLRKVLSHSELSLFKRGKSIDEGDPPSPPGPRTPSIPPSPQRLRKKTSRMNVAQAPRLEPAFRSNFDGSRRQSAVNRSPSPPSPRNANKKATLRRPSLGMSLRSKSSDNVLNSAIAASTAPNSNTGFGSITASTESVCRTLRTYRKKLVNSSSGDTLTPACLRELEKELKLTARVLNEKSQGKSIDEATMARLLDQASEKIVGMLDERIKERVESEVRRSADNSPASSVPHLIFPASSVASDEDDVDETDVATGAMKKISLQT